MASFGPQYCETPAIEGAFPIEPANVITSGVIVLFGIAALVLVLRRTPRSIDLYLLCALLMVNGVGSILWHGLRTPWALSLDVMPALAFVLIMAVLWARQVGTLWHAVGIAALLLALPVAMRYIDFGLSMPGRFATVAPVIVAAGLWLVWRSYAVSKPAALTGGAAIVSACAALAFRSLDAQACAFVSTGSHPLWHVFLSAAAFLCLLTLITLKQARAGARPSEPVLAPAQ